MHVRTAYMKRSFLLASDEFLSSNRAAPDASVFVEQTWDMLYYP